MTDRSSIAKDAILKFFVLFVVLAVAGALVASMALRTEAFPSKPAACSTCHGLDGAVSITVIQTDETPTDVTYSINGSGPYGDGSGWAVFDETGNIANGYGPGTITLSKDGKTYRFWWVDDDVGGAKGGSAYKDITTPLPPTNNPPVAVDDAYSVDEDNALSVAAPGVLGNDSDADSDPLTAVLVSGVSNGTLSLNSDGSFSYTPDTDFNGSDSFTYKANDGVADSNVATVTITVNAVNDAPDAVDDSATTTEDTAVVIDILTNDSDVDGDSLTVTAVTQPASGSAAITGGGTTVTYTPNSGFTGTDSFTYTISDGNGGTDTATVTVTVNPAGQVDYDLLGIRAAKAYSNEPALVHLRFRNVGAAEGDAYAELFLHAGTPYSWQYVTGQDVTDLTGDGPGKDSLPIIYPAPGTYTVRVELTSDTGMDFLEKTVIIRK